MVKRGTNTHHLRQQTAAIRESLLSLLVREAEEDNDVQDDQANLISIPLFGIRINQMHSFCVFIFTGMYKNNWYWINDVLCKSRVGGAAAEEPSAPGLVSPLFVRSALQQGPCPDWCVPANAKEHYRLHQWGCQGFERNVNWRIKIRHWCTTTGCGSNIWERASGSTIIIHILQHLSIVISLFPKQPVTYRATVIIHINTSQSMTQNSSLPLLLPF